MASFIRYFCQCEFVKSFKIPLSTESLEKELCRQIAKFSDEVCRKRKHQVGPDVFIDIPDILEPEVHLNTDSNNTGYVLIPVAFRLVGLSNQRMSTRVSTRLLNTIEINGADLLMRNSITNMAYASNEPERLNSGEYIHVDNNFNVYAIKGEYCENPNIAELDKADVRFLCRSLIVSSFRVEIDVDSENYLCDSNENTFLVDYPSGMDGFDFKTVLNKFEVEGSGSCMANVSHVQYGGVEILIDASKYGSAGLNAFIKDYRSVKSGIENMLVVCNRIQFKNNKLIFACIGMTFITDVSDAVPEYIGYKLQESSDKFTVPICNEYALKLESIIEQNKLPCKIGSKMLTIYGIMPEPHEEFDDDFDDDSDDID